MTVAIRYPAPPGWGEVMAAAGDTYAGALSSLTWLGTEFVDRKDHGRGWQSAVSFDGLGEADNPTEAGSEADGSTVNPSSSRLLGLAYAGNVLVTATQMALWKKIGSVRRSNTILQKQVTLGFRATWNAIEHQIRFLLPENEFRKDAQFEILTGYMPVAFSRFEVLDLATGNLSPAPPIVGEQPLPLVFSTPDGSRAAGCYCPQPLARGGYGLWNEGDCVKWNVVSRVANPAGEYPYQVFTPIGNRDDVRRTLMGLVPRT